MATWFPDVENPWMAPAIVLGGSVLLYLMLHFSGFPTKMSLEVLEFSHLETIKESSKNVWTNLAVTAALFLTVVFAMLQVDPIEPNYELDDDARDTVVHLTQAYVSVVCVSLLCCLFCLFECVINLTFVEPLRNEDTVKFFMANTSSIGYPILWLMLSASYIVLATSIWVWATYGAGAGTLMGVVVILFVVVVGLTFTDRLLFDPSGQTKKSEEWQFTNLPVEKWPRRVQARDERSVRIFHRMGKAATASVWTADG